MKSVGMERGLRKRARLQGAVRGEGEHGRRSGPRLASLARGVEAMPPGIMSCCPAGNIAMEAEQLNLIASTLDGLADRAQAMRRYL